MAYTAIDVWVIWESRDSMLKKLVNSNMVKGMDVTNTHLDSICEDCILGKMDKCQDTDFSEKYELGLEEKSWKESPRVK